MARSWGKKKKRKREPVVPSLPEPVPTHRFVIDANTDIIGVVQKTQATKEDTLTDIARRFNVGYEEIVRAESGCGSVAAGRKSPACASFFYF